MAYKIVGADDNSDFAPRVEARLKEKFYDKGTPLPAGAAGATGAKGDTGNTGATGPAGTITGATASALAPGATPTVTLGGTASARTIALGIPRGADGAQGPKGDKGDSGTSTFREDPSDPGFFIF